MDKPRICFNAIVKDEAPIIARCLESVAPYIDCYLICDTGSSDRTIDIVKQVFSAAGVPGEVRSIRFLNFEQARNEALQAARASNLGFDYLLLCDADMELVVTEGDFRHRLVAPAYNLLQRTSAALEYQNLRLLRRDVTARYRGVTHEYLDVGQHARPLLDGACFLDHAAGSSRLVKYERDIALLLQGLRDEPDNSRYLFYLAQSYRDSQQLEKSLETYGRRVAAGGWEQEVWYAMLQEALLSERLALDDQLVVARFLAAYQYRPQRAETLVELARYYREHGARHALAYMVARQAVDIAPTSDALFVDAASYSWRALDEFSIAGYWTGRHAESAAACERLLALAELPTAERPRVIANLNFSLRQLGRPDYLADAGGDSPHWGSSGPFDERG